jgi:hypothetical protein
MTTNGLPPDYYRNYFLQMLDLVTERYGDLLSTEDWQFIDSIRQCPPEPIRLLIRLYLRKGPLFLADKLNYEEISDTQTALTKLIQLSLIEQNPDVFAWELITLLPIAQSRDLFSDTPKIRKADLLTAWLEDETLKSSTDWGVTLPIVMPCHSENYRRLQLLYFGNDKQNLTEFILEDLGLFQYEKYSLDKTCRLFDRSEDIDHYLELSDLTEQFYLMNETKDWSLTLELVQAVAALELPERLRSKQYRLLNKIAYRLEQLGELDNALEIFQSNVQPPSRERQVRILFKQKKYNTALTLLNHIAENPYGADESIFYDRFINKVRNKLTLPRLPIAKPTINTMHHQWRRSEDSVEQQACIFFPGSVWLENSLPLGIFGLIHWNIIFQNVPGVWHHPFQSAPTDLNDPEFVPRRKDTIQHLHQKTQDQWMLLIRKNWEQKFGLRNPFVNWNVLSLEIVATCFRAFNKTQWLGIFEHLLSDLRQHRSGFPDLFQAKPGQYRFIEIKGPGDKLQDNQITWLKVFQRLEIPAEVCYVQYIED